MASIRERSGRNGLTWAVLFRDGGRQTSVTFVDRGAAEQFRQLVEGTSATQALKSLEEAQEGELTVAELAEQFLCWKVRDVEERTIAQYRRDVKNWVLPWFGHRPAEQVDEADVQEWVDHMAKRLSPKSVADRHMLLSSMYSFGRRKSRGLVSHNPCQETELPRRRKGLPKGTTVPEFQAILDAAGRRNPDARDFILFLGESGWRWSEAAGLLVHHVYDDGDQVWVDMRDVFRVDGSGRQLHVLDTAKSYASHRRIRLFPASAAAVRRRLIGKGPHDFVFTNSRGGHWRQHTFLRETWPRIVRDAGLYQGPHKSPTPHWLRHMHVAVLVASGASLAEIQRRIGHESITTTLNTYGSLVGDIGDNALESAADIMAGRRIAPGVAPAVIAQVLDAAVPGGEDLQAHALPAEVVDDVDAVVEGHLGDQDAVGVVDRRE